MTIIFFSPPKPVIAAVALALVLGAASKPSLAQSLLSPPAGPEGAGAPADNLVIYAPFGGGPYAGLGDDPSQWLEATLPPDWVTAEVAPPPEGPTLEELFQWVESGKGGEAYPLLAERETLEWERAAQSGRDPAKLQKEYLIHLLRAGERVAPPEVQERTARRFTEAYPDDPRFPLAYFYLSQALFRQGRPLEESFFFDREALAELPPWMQTRYLVMKAQAAAARRDFAAAAGYRLAEMIPPTTLRETTRDDVLETLSRLRDVTLLETFLQEHPEQEWIAAAWPFLRVQALINGGAMGQALLALETIRREGLADTPARIKRLHSARTEIENRIATRPRRIGVLLPLGSTHATLRRLALDTLDGLRLGVQFLETEQPARARLARLLAADPLPLSESPKANGRVAEPSIELVIRDTANIPDQAALEVEKLVREEGVIAIIGPIARSESDAAATRAEELGVPLISLSLTLEIPKGSRFTFRHSKSQEEEVRDLRHARSGRLRMISTPPLGHTVVPHALKRFLKERPKVRVSYDIRRLETVIQSVETGAAEIGFVLGVRHHPGLTVTQLHVGEMVCVTPADHPLAGKEKITPADITSHRLIGLETSLGVSVRSAFDTAGVPYMSDVQVRYCHTACVLANAGIGVAVVDPWSARFAPAQEIVTRPFSPSTQVVAAAIHRKDTTWSLLAEALVRELQSQFVFEPKHESRQE
ncbi:MAG: ABC transporter substrate-binding protein [Proteobacteria bacterium]|nr:ABC transporter substrate-binding protein [Pseudomonadota bacterium]